MTKEERIKLRETLLYLADGLIVLNDIEHMHSCNDCGIQRKCQYVPRIGQPVRYNCPLWEGNEQQES